MYMYSYLLGSLEMQRHVSRVNHFVSKLLRAKYCMDRRHCDDDLTVPYKVSKTSTSNFVDSFSKYARAQTRFLL